MEDKVMARIGLMRVLVAVAMVVAMGLGASGAWAGQAWDAMAFRRAQEAGSPILVHVTAPWCPTCKAQKPVVEKLEASNPALKVFLVDFDTQKDAMAALNAQVQSTLIAFRGKAETGRSSGVVDPAAITDLVVRASH